MRKMMWHKIPRQSVMNSSICLVLTYLPQLCLFSIVFASHSFSTSSLFHSPTMMNIVRIVEAREKVKYQNIIIIISTSVSCQRKSKGKWREREMQEWLTLSIIIIINVPAAAVDWKWCEFFLKRKKRGNKFWMLKSVYRSNSHTL
jgi:hypothetical protein